MGMFFGESGKTARRYGIGTYEEIEDVYSRVENEDRSYGIGPYEEEEDADDNE